MIPLPSKIKVGPMVYRISEDPGEHSGFCENKNEYYYGWCDHHKLTINLDPKLPLPVKQDTLLHELDHCLWEVCGLKSLKGMGEERVIRHTNTVRLDTYQRNPLLMAYLMQQESLEDT